MKGIFRIAARSMRQNKKDTLSSVLLLVTAACFLTLCLSFSAAMVELETVIETADRIGRGEDAAVVRILRLLHLSDREFYYPHELSGGQQQRVAIGRALLTAPKILLSDEPTGNLDSVNTAEVLSLLREANRTQKQTVLLVTHDKEVAKYADRLLTLSDGRLVSDEAL